MIENKDWRESARKHSEDIDRKPSEEQLKMIKLVGKGFKLSDGTEVNYIGGVYGLNGDFFLMYPNGEVRLLLNFKLVREGRKKWIEISKFMLIDLGVGCLLDTRSVGATQWERQNKDFEKVGKYYEKI